MEAVRLNHSGCRKRCTDKVTSSWFPSASVIIFSMFLIIAIFCCDVSGYSILPVGAAYSYKITN